MCVPLRRLLIVTLIASACGENSSLVASAVSPCLAIPRLAGLLFAHIAHTENKPVVAVQAEHSERSLD